MDEKVIDTNSFCDDAGEYADVTQAIMRVSEIICTASKLTDEDAKKSLLDGAKIVLENCINALDSRSQEEDTEVIEEDD